MSIPFHCPHCGTFTEVIERYAGMTGPCVNCGQTITVPPRAGAGYDVPRSGGVGATAFAVVVGAIVVCVALGAFFYWSVSLSTRAVPAPAVSASAPGVQKRAKPPVPTDLNPDSSNADEETVEADPLEWLR